MMPIGLIDGKLKKREINLKEKIFGLIKIGTLAICHQKPLQLENLIQRLLKEAKILSDWLESMRLWIQRQLQSEDFEIISEFKRSDNIYYHFRESIEDLRKFL